MSFIHPEFAYLFILVILMVILQLRQEQNSLSHPAIAPHLAKALTNKRQVKRQKWLIVYYALTLSVVTLSLMQPTMNLNSGRDPRPLFIILDQSPKVSAQSTARAKRLLTKLLHFGIERPKMIMAYAGSAHALFPLTEQDQVNQLYMQYLDPKIMPLEGNNVSTTLPLIQENEQAMTLGFDILLLTSSSVTGQKTLIDFVDKNSGQILYWPLTKNAEKVITDSKVSQATYRQVLQEKSGLFQAVAKLSHGKREPATESASLGYPLVILSALLLLPWFVRGFHLNASKRRHTVVLIGLFFSLNASAELMDWFYTKDQQGAQLMAQNKYAQAAETFENKKWKAAAYYQAKNFKEAKKIWQNLGDLDSLYNLATLYAADRKYSISIKLYQLLLKIDSKQDMAKQNLQIIIKTLEEVNRQSEAQQEEQGDNQNSVSLDEEDPLSQLFEDEGADRKAIGQRTQTNQELKAEQLLKDPKKVDKWLRNISKDPKKYLRARFFIEEHYREELKSE